MGIDVAARELIVVHTAQDLTELFNQRGSLSHYNILGGGSNIVFTGDVTTPLIVNEIKGRTIVDETEQSIDIAYGGGEIWHDAVLDSVNNGWGGLENLSLIPGKVGASPVQNIGAYGSEIKDCFVWLNAFHLESGEFHKLYLNDCEFGYRDSVFKRQFKNQYIITQVCFRLSKSPNINVQYGDIQAVLNLKGISKPTIKDVSNAVIEIRQSKLPDPAVLGNCGSFFKNPVVSISQFEHIQANFPDVKHYPVSTELVKIPAGWLIEKAGWKGKKVGNVGVHEKQALVLVNYGSANGSEIFKLAQSIQQDILQKFGVSLEMEVNIW